MSDARTRWGITLPQAFYHDPVDMGLVRSFAARAEELGYDSCWVLGQNGAPYNTMEPVSLLTYVAALTTRIRLGTSVLVLPLYNPMQLADAIRTLDVMSGGRTVMGIGLGGPHRYEMLHRSTAGRVSHFLEALKVIKGLWTQPSLTFEGSHLRLDGVRMEPKPVQKPHPPVWFGARHPSALRRAVRHGDGWMGAGSSSIDDFREQAGLLRRYLEESGRDPATFAIAKRIYVAVDSDGERAIQRLRERFAIQYGRAGLADETAVWGSPGECAERIGQVVSLGAELVLLHPLYDYREQMERLSEEVIPLL